MISYLMLNGLGSAAVAGAHKSAVGGGGHPLPASSRAVATAGWAGVPPVARTLGLAGTLLSTLIMSPNALYPQRERDSSRMGQHCKSRVVRNLTTPRAENPRKSSVASLHSSRCNHPHMLCCLQGCSPSLPCLLPWQRFYRSCPLMWSQTQQCCRYVPNDRYGLEG